MDTNEPNPSEKDSASTLDCNQSCNTSETLNPEATGSKSKSSTNDEFDIVQEIVKSSDMTKQHRSPLPNIFKHIMRGTQTPLTLIGVTMPKYNSEEEKKSDPPVQRTKDSGKTEISVALNSSPENEGQSSSSGAKESPGPSTSVRSSFSQFRVEAVTVKFSHEAATQATPPHPSLTSTKSTLPHPRDVVKIATSVSSNRSGPKSEVLTVTTDYSSRTPDARSLLLDVIDEDHPRRYINVEPSTPAIAVTNSSPMLRLAGMPELGMAPPYINGQTSLLNLERNREGRRRSWWNCLRQNTPQGEEPDVQAYGIGPPPTYSGIFREPRSIYTESRIQLPARLSNDTTASFVTPIPPPSYAQAQGLSSRGIWTPRPTATICPRCATVVVTAVEIRRSAITHVSALALFLCGCWPCCLIPYCVDTCKSTHHYCPVCRTYLGTYTPW